MTKQEILKMLTNQSHYEPPPDELTKHRLANTFRLGKELGFDAAIDAVLKIMHTEEGFEECQGWSMYEKIRALRGDDNPVFEY